MGPTTWEDVRRALASRTAARVGDDVSRRAAVALILREGRAGLELLLIRRAEHPQDPWSGQMAFPGGRHEPGDADLGVTAIRETAEEIGMDLERDAECLGALDEVRAMARMRPMNLAITPFVFRLRDEPPVRLSSEVVSVHWLPLDEMLGPQRRSTMEHVHQGATLQFPCLSFDGLEIWGLTYRMFSNLETILVPALSARDDVPGPPRG